MSAVTNNHAALLAANEANISQKKKIGIVALVGGVFLMVIGLVGVALTLTASIPLATITIVAITMTDIVKSFVLTTAGKVMLASIISVFCGGIAVCSGSSFLAAKIS